MTGAAFFKVQENRTELGGRCGATPWSINDGGSCPWLTGHRTGAFNSVGEEGTFRRVVESETVSLALKPFKKMQTVLTGHRTGAFNYVGEEGTFRGVGETETISLAFQPFQKVQSSTTGNTPGI